jgi:geranylgeranyl pyrophosphate synthase
VAWGWSRPRHPAATRPHAPARRRRWARAWPRSSRPRRSSAASISAASPCPRRCGTRRCAGRWPTSWPAPARSSGPAWSARPGACAAALATRPAELGFIVEVLHAGSLIIDDIEDDSTTRRGDVALHLRYGLPRALNAGCWLYFWPHVLLERLAAPPAIELACRRWIDATLLRAHQGQALDLSARITELDPADVPAVVATTTRLKTGALMQLAAALGAIVAGASPAQVEALATFGRDLGVGLQMLDDLGSLSCPSRAAKALEDVRGARPTWPWAWAAERVTPARFAALVEPVRALREPADAASDLAALRAVTAPLLAEVGDPGRALVHAHLQAAFARLGATFTGPVVAPTLAAIRAEIETLEMSYG